MTEGTNVAIMNAYRRCVMEQKRRRRMQNRRRRRRALCLRMLGFIILLVAIILGSVLFKKYGPSKDRMNLDEYYGITDSKEVAVTIDDEVLGAHGRIYDGEPYVEYALIRDYVNDRVYVDMNENLLLYTLPNGTIRAEVGSRDYTLQKEKVSRDYSLLKMEGDVAYVALAFVQEHTNMEYRLYQDQDVNRIMIESDWGRKTVATVRKNTQVRYRGGNKSPILTDLGKKSEVVIVEDEDNWMKVRTSDGFIGYVRTSHLKNIREEDVSRAFSGEVSYSHIKKDYTINMAWHVVTNETANNTILSTIADTKGLTTISPTWFTVADTKGNLRSLASSQYVNYAHQSGIEVWALLRDFDGGISSYEESYRLLSSTSHRERLINQLMAEVLQKGIDGINVDFEKISEECGEHYIQFIRELSVKCRQNEIVLSVDNYSPKSYNAHYCLEEQGEVADYVIIMGYDEHYAGSAESGPVASPAFVKEGIEATLAKVPKERVINAVPFYTRLWKEVPKSEQQLKKEEGTEAAEYTMRVSSEAYGMDEAQMVIDSAGAKVKKDKDVGMNYAQWKANGATYKIWLEDLDALEGKLQLMKEYELAGVSAWRLGFETDKAWDLIQKYVN